MASAVTFLQVSEANSLDMEPSAESNDLPLRAIHAARHTSRREASTPVFMSASLNATAWFSTIGLPNCTRVLAYSSEYSYAARAMPTAIAPTAGGLESNGVIGGRAALSPAVRIA